MAAKVTAALKSKVRQMHLSPLALSDNCKINEEWSPCVSENTVSGYSILFLRCTLLPQTPPKRSPELLQHNLCNTVDWTHLHQPRHDRLVAIVPLEPSNVSPSSPCFPQEGHSLHRYQYDRQDGLNLLPLWLAMFLPYPGSALSAPHLPVVEANCSSLPVHGIPAAAKKRHV